MSLLTREHRIACLLILFAVLVIAPALRGQEPEPAAQPEPAAGAVEQPGEQDANEQPKQSDEDAAADDNSILAMIVDSGVTGMVFMGILGLFSIVAGTVAVERAVNMRRNRVMPGELLEDVATMTQRRVDPERLAQVCAKCPGALATIIEAALLRVGRPLIEVEKSMEDAAVREMSELRSRIRPLNTVGSIAPLVGLLGTVVGMIIAFHTASQAGLGKAELLAKGIYMALLTTAGGLSVAIPSLLLSSYFNGRLDRFFREIDRSLMPLLPLLAGASHTSEVVVSKSTRPRRSRDL